MSDDSNQQPGTQDEIKVDDINAPINIKVLILLFLYFFYLNLVFLSILVQVVSSTGEEVFFKIKRSTKLTKLQGAYASKVGKDVGSIRSVFYFILFNK